MVILRGAALFLTISVLAPSILGSELTPGILKAALPWHWEHSRPLPMMKGSVAVSSESSPWRRIPTKHWLEKHVPAYATEMGSTLAQRSEGAPLDFSPPAGIVRVDLSSYKSGDTYDWKRLRSDYDVRAIVEIAPPALSRDGNVAVLGYFSIEPDRPPTIYFSVLTRTRDGSWALSATSAASSLGEPAP